jgi:hypothetical protein
LTVDCFAPRHDTEPEPAEPHSCLCKPCRIRLARDLRRLPGLHAELSDVLAVTRRAGGDGRGHGDGLPYNDRVSDCRSQIGHDLRWWAQHAAEDRRARLGLVSVPALAGYLHGAVRWARFRDWAGDLAGVMAGNRGQAVALLDPWVTLRFPVRGRDGLCTECASGRIYVTVYASDGDKRRSHAACDECGQSWLPEQWARLGTLIIRRRELAA